MESIVDVDLVTAGEPLTDGECCRVEGGALLHVHDAAPPSPLACFVHDSFRALALNPRFACLGGQAAVRQNAYRFGLYGEIGRAASSMALARDLASFNADIGLRTHPFTAFVASFVSPVTGGEEAFERALWTTLEQLSDVDPEPWVGNRRADPADPEFAFSFGGVALFVIGLHAGSSRLARRFAWPTLIFNPHDQFDRLRRSGKYARLQTMIRRRDVALQGTINPMLADFGEASEARQYSGRAVGADWECPFRSREGKPVSRPEEP